jgi:hypothetical protein
MSVVIIGGNECMYRRYMDICKEFGYKSKVFAKPERDLVSKIGSPDLIVVFTNPVSHGLVDIAKKKVAGQGISLAQSHCGSGTALKNILSDFSKRPQNYAR